MFWTDWGKASKIEKCGMNGDQATRKEIVKSRLVWPNALSIDFTLDRIYWADAKLRRIESADLTGGQRRVVLQQHVHYPFSMVVFENYMYWTDWSKEAVFRANKFTGANKTALAEGLFHTPMGITAYHRQRQPPGKPHTSLPKNDLQIHFLLSSLGGMSCQPVALRELKKVCI